MNVKYPIRFAHCDPAGIAFYPRLFELYDAEIEDWCAGVLGISRRIVHVDLGQGMPAGDMRARLVAPSRLGEMLDIEISGFEVDYIQVLMTLANTRAHLGLTCGVPSLNLH